MSKLFNNKTIEHIQCENDNYDLKIDLKIASKRIEELEEANKHYKTCLEAIKNHIEIMTNNNSYKLNDAWNIVNDYLKPITPTKGEDNV